MPTRVSSPDPPQETQYVSQSGDSQNLWEADCILDERGPAATGSYLVKWKGTDPDTGEIYKPTWEKKSGCTPDLIRDWKKLKKADPSVVGKGTKEIKRVETRSSKRKRANGSAGMKKRTRLRRKSETGGYALVPTVMEVLIDVALGGAKPAVAESSSSVRTRSTMTPPPRPKPSEVPVILKFTQPGPTRIARQTRSSLARAESTDLPPPRTPSRAVSESPSGGRTKLVEVEIPIARRQSPVSIRQPTVEKADMEGAEMVTPMDQAVLDDVDIPPDTSLIEETTAALDSFMQGIEGAHRSTGKEIVAGDGDLNGGQLGGLGGEGQADEAPAPTDTVEDGALELEISKNLKTDILLAQTESQDEIAGTKDGRAHTTPLQRKTINISVNIPAQDGPGPTTTKNMQNGSKSSKLGSVPQPSPSVFRPFLPTPEETFHTQTESSIPFSQLDPIVDYSSPAGPAANGPHAIQISAEEVVPDGSPIEAVMGDHDTKEELQDSIPPRVVKRIIDGEEVYVVWSESTEDEKGASQREESPTREDVQLDRQHVWEDEDLAMLTAGSDGEALLVIPQDRQVMHTGETVEETSGGIASSDDANPRNPALAARLRERDHAIEDLTVRLFRADASLDSLTTDLNFYRSEYMEARDRVIAGNQRAAQLEEQVEILRGQLQLGLKQRDLHFGAVKAQSAAETDRYRVQNKLLLEQARLTDDAVRRKAAQYIPLKKDNDRLKENLYEEETKVAKLQRRNEELVDQVDLLRARQMGVFGDEDDSSGTEGDSSSPLGHRDPAQLGYSVRPAGVASSSEVFSSLQILPEVSQVAEDIGFQVMQEMEPGSTVLGKAESQESLVEGGSGVRCKWRQEGVQCAVILDTFQDVAQHSSDHSAGRVDTMGETIPTQ